MTNPAAGSAIDPLAVFAQEHTRRHGPYPMPLISTEYDIRIDGGFAIVETRRVFRNDEAQSIEATLTFPLPVQAVLFSLEAEHDGRKLKARVRKRAEAREIYEEAVEAGKAAVLHEELLRGIHMLSVAHIAPGAEIAVTARWATTLTRGGQSWHLHVPLTVGQVYGCSPLADGDALEGGGANGTANVVVRCASGEPRLSGANLIEGHARVPLNAPIGIDVTGAVNRALSGVGADGRGVTLHVSPLREGQDSLDLAVLVDRSGSMSGACTGDRGGPTKLEAIIHGLTALAPRLRKGDAIDLWEFDDSLGHVGTTRDEHPHWRIRRHDWRPEAAFEQLVRRLRGPGGGTEIGHALEGVLSASRARDLLLITDGKSYALDVQKLARHGRRVAVVLVGEDSLEANVGHLAATTGGSVFVVTGHDIASTVAAAAETLRSCPLDVGPIEAQPETVEAVRGGAIVKATWSDATPGIADELFGAGVAACAAGLALARMDEAVAADLAERAGIASHLTSLILVDEAAVVQADVPAMRKVRLPTPRVAMGATVDCLFAIGADPLYKVESYLRLPLREANVLGRPERDARRPVIHFDWDVAPAQLLEGDLSSLDTELAKQLCEMADDPQIQLRAAELGIKPIVLIIAALAHSDRHQSRTAERIARKVFGGTPPGWIEELEAVIVGSLWARMSQIGKGVFV